MNKPETLLTEAEIYRLGDGKPGQTLQFARAVEQAIIAKLASHPAVIEFLRLDARIANGIEEFAERGVEPVELRRLMKKEGSVWLPASEWMSGPPEDSWVALAKNSPDRWRIGTPLIGREVAKAFEIALAKQPGGEVVITKNESGQIVAVTRQDEDGKILEVLAESEQSKGGEPVVMVGFSGLLKLNGDPVTLPLGTKLYASPPLQAVPASSSPC